MKARRIIPHVYFNDTNISHLINDMTYTDTEDITDDVSVSIVRSRGLFDMWPSIGDKMTVGADMLNFPTEGQNDYKKIGSFEIDEFSQDESLFKISGVAVPISTAARVEKKYRTWENIRLSGILSDIAAAAGLGSIYDSDYDPLFDKKEQSNQSDLEFLSSRAKEAGLALKITDGRLVLFDEEKYDSAAAAAQITRGSSNVVREPNFKCSSKNLYSSCEITFTDSKTDQTYNGSFAAPENLGVNRVLRLRESYNSEKDDMNFKRKAKYKLREQNKGQWTADIEVVGNFYYYAGTNIILSGWGNWDGKYHITEASHKIGGGFVTSLSLRKCLEGY